MKVHQDQHAFFETQKTKDVSFRKKALQRLEKEIIKREDAIAQALFKDFKKPRFEALIAETQFVLADLRHTIKKMDYWAKPKRVGGSLLNWPSSDWIYPEPYGGVLIIAPWNYPFQLVFSPLIGAVASGNVAVIKPSEITPHTAAVIAEIVAAVFEPGHVAVVQGNADTAQQLLAQKWDYIFFTGSTRVGQIVYEHAAKHLTPVTLELGGKNPTIVSETASIELAAKRIVWGKFINAGQTCIATDYILVHKNVKDKLVSALQNNITRCYGQNIENSPDYARTVSKTHFRSLLAMLQGQEIIFGGHYNAEDHYLSPTLVNEPKMGSSLMQGEIFGPILPIMSYENEADIEKCIANFGKPLALYVFSTCKAFQRKMISRFSFGGGAINDTVIQITNKNLPFGGVGSSGIGAYHGKTTFDLFSHKKSIIKKANWLDIPIRYAPYTLPEYIVKKVKYFF